MREPRKRQQAAAAARNNVAPVERSTNLMEMPLDEFQGALAELAQQGVDTDALLRQYRAANSPFAAVNRAAEASSAELAAAGRRPVAGTAGLLSRPIDDAGGVRFEPAAGLLGMLAGVGRQIDAPMAAYQELIPAEDMDLEALGTAGVATLGGGAVTRPAGSFGMGGREGANVSKPTFDQMRAAARQRREERAAMLQDLTQDERPVRMAGKYISALVSRSPDREGWRVTYFQPDGSPSGHFDAADKTAAVDRALDDQLKPVQRPIAANASPEAGLLSAAAARTPSEQMARQILDMRAAGRAGDVTDEMMAAADPQYMFANTPLPMDEASRMVRAGEMGFDTGVPLYHGTDRDFAAFDPRRFGEKDPGWYGRGVTSDTDPEVAAGYADYNEPEMGQQIIPNFTKGRYIEWPEGQLPFGNPRESIAGTRDMQALGYSGSRMTNDRDLYGDAPDVQSEYVTFNPANIRSRFARFDPEFAHLSNLSAANIDPLSGLFGAMAAEEQRRRGNAP